jgi:hypothetical protein
LGYFSQPRHSQSADDFSRLTQIGERDDYTLRGGLDEALIAGWAGDERLRRFALQETEGEHRKSLRRHRPDFGLLINGFPGDRQVAELIAADFRKQYPHSLFDRDDLRDLAKHFKNDSIVVPALESWVFRRRSDDAYMLSHAARVAATTTLKTALLRCVEGNHLAFWAASALVDLWGASDEEVHSTLNKAAEEPIDKRQNIAHVLPLVVRRLKEDDTAYAQMRGLLIGKPSPGVKASFPRLLARARGLTEDLYTWCQSETQRDKDLFVGEVGLDLIASQKRLVVQSLFDVLSERDV